MLSQNIDQISLIFLNLKVTWLKDWVDHRLVEANLVKINLILAEMWSLSREEITILMTCSRLLLTMPKVKDIKTILKWEYLILNKEKQDLAAKEVIELRLQSHVDIMAYTSKQHQQPSMILPLNLKLKI